MKELIKTMIGILIWSEFFFFIFDGSKFFFVQAAFESTLTRCCRKIWIFVETFCSDSRKVL